MPKLYWSLISIALILILTVRGCSHKTNPVALPYDLPESFTWSGTKVLPQNWWYAFEDENLNIIVDSALQSNLDLKIAWERLQAAKAVVKRESASLFPRLDGSLQAELSRPTDNNRIMAGLSSTYEIDLWGRIGSAVEAERYRAEATYADYRAAAMSLSAEIVRTWFQLTEATNQLTLAGEQVLTNSRVLELMKIRFQSGQLRNVDILRQEQLLEATREQEILAEIRVSLLEHQLAVLLGNPPMQNSNFQTEQLPELLPIPETGIPAALIEQRPDVQSAFQLLQAADKDLASAVSNQYPRLTISGSISSASDNFNNLLENWAYSIAGNLLAPLFYGGELKAEVSRNEAVKQQRLYAYAQTVLTAFREVEDALIQEKNQNHRIENIHKQVELASNSYNQLKLEYFNGISDYLDVLTALDNEQQLRRNLLSARLNLLEYRIALYRALAGSFETPLETN